MRSWTSAILHLFSQETDILIKVSIKYVNIKLWDILGCFHYILNAPRNSTFTNDLKQNKKRSKNVHSCRLSLFKLPIVIKNFVLSIFEWLLYTCFTVS